MESSSDGRLLLRCDGCGVEAWIGPARGGWDAWCECCQQAVWLAIPGSAPPAEECPRCGTPLTVAAPRFIEAGGELQHLAAVLAAATGDPQRLRRLLPERPRYLADLDPPEARAGDAPDVRAALEALASGRFREARAQLDALAAPAPHVMQAQAVARTRAGDLAQAEAAWSARLAHGEDPVARLDRGVLRATRGALAEALEDFAHAGDTREAHWNRAAAALALAVEQAGGLPPRVAIETARAEAGPASAYWSDPTVGRLLWTLLLERAAGARGIEALRAAEAFFEFDTFWDRALVLWGFAARGAEDDARRVAVPLAAQGFDALETEPWARWPEGPWTRGVADARMAFARGDWAGALATLDALGAREDVRLHRLPCRACGAGTVGAEAVEEAGHGE